MAHPRKPTHLKILEGNPGKKKLPAHEPIPTQPLRAPPAHLTVDEKRLWREVVGSMPEGLYTRADKGTLERYCQKWAKHRQLGEEIAHTGNLVMGQAGNWVKNPLFLAQAQMADDMHRCATELGLTPASRSRIEHRVEPAPVESDEYRKLIGIG